MLPETDAPAYRIWGVDNVVYGPVDLPVLVNWVQERRVVGETWLHLCHENAWRKAADLPELQMFFHRGAGQPSPVVPLTEGKDTALALKAGSLRRIKILACLSDAQLEEFARSLEVRRVRQWEEIVREGSPGDAMFLLLEGEVRVRMMIAGKETILATLGAGEFFGELALFDHGPRAADVVANTDCLLLRLAAAAMLRVEEEAPALAAPFLRAVSRTLIARIRADNKRYRDSVAFARGAGG